MTQNIDGIQTIDYFEKIKDHEQVVLCNDPHSGLKAIIAIHDTTLGPALGGTRMFPYASFEDALDDVLRLSEGMTNKCAAAGLDFGGGKAVIIGDPKTDRTPALFRAFGQYVDSLNGRFYTGTDMGTMPEDFVEAAKETQFINGIPEAYGGSGDSSIPTAHGVLYALEATSNYVFNHQDLGLNSYAIQGLGKVGYKIAQRLLELGATVYATDINESAIEQLTKETKDLTGQLTIVGLDDIYDVKADIFVPCAMGSIINDETLEKLQVKAIVGSANNQLKTKEIAEKLKQAGIVYAPDFIVNSGGLIQVADELYGPNHERVLKETKAIFNSLESIFAEADANNITTLEAASIRVQAVLDDQRNRNNFFARHRRPKWQVKE